MPKPDKPNRSNYFLLFLLVFSCPAIVFSQMKFEQGYYMDSSGKKTDCLIRNVDWIYNPTHFEYKTGANDARIRKTVHEVKEFGIGNTIKYISITIKMDRSTDNLDDNEISDTFDPEWKVETIFLKVLTDGDATLYAYEEQGFARYFYKTNTSPVEQLVYKKYRKRGDISYQFNRNYINQLFAHVNCAHIPINRMEDISYTDYALLKWFKKHNQCVDPNRPVAISGSSRKWFFPKIFAGAGMVSYRSGKSVIPEESNVDYGSRTSFVYGLELEALLPFNNNKWSAFLESSVLSYSSSGVNSSGTTLQIAYHSVNLLAGIGYYMFVNEHTKILVDAAMSKDIKQTKIAPSFGVGISYSKFMVEYRYYYAKRVVEGYFDRSEGTQFKNMTFVLKYTLF